MFPLKDNIPTARFPVVTVVLIAINVIVYLLPSAKAGIDFFGGARPAASLVHYGAIPYELTHPGKHCDCYAAPQAPAVVLRGPAGVTGTPAPQLATLAHRRSRRCSLHGGLLHLGGNMLFLWIFGNNVEDAMGRVRFVVFYLLGGLAALGAADRVDPSSTAPTLGASGAIAAVLGGYILLYPRARVLTLVFIILFFTVIEMPALCLLG